MEEKIKTMLPLLNEYQRRIFLASEAMSYGRRGIQKVSKISGFSMNTIRKGIAEIKANEDLRRERIRKEGGGRKSLTEKYPRIKEHILAIVNPQTYGNPERVLSYTTLSVRTIEDLSDPFSEFPLSALEQRIIRAVRCLSDDQQDFCMEALESAVRRMRIKGSILEKKDSPDG